MTTTTPPRRYALRETVQLDLDDGTHIGTIEAYEPGGGLRRRSDGWAYHVRLPGHDTREPRVVIVGESELRKLTEE